MKIAIHTIDIRAAYRDGEARECPEIEVSEELWREYEAALDRLQEVLRDIERLRQLLMGETKSGG